MQSTIARVIALGATALLVIPGTAVARGGHDDPAPQVAGALSGQDDQTSGTEHAAEPNDGASLGHETGDDAQGPRADASPVRQEGAQRRGGHGQDVQGPKRFNVRGTVISADPSGETVVIKVTKVNHGHRGRALAGRTLVLDVSSARLDVSDVNGDGQADLADVASGDQVDAVVTIGASSGQLVAQRLRDKHS